MNKLLSMDSIANKLESDKTYTKEDIVSIMYEMPADYDFSVAARRIRHFSGLVSQGTLEDIINTIEDTTKPSFFD